MKSFLTALLLALSFFSFAQSNFQPGYIVTNKGDTLKGYIDYKEKDINPAKFTFRTSKDSDSQVITLNEYVALGINNLETYQRFAVDISMSKEQLADLSYGMDTTFRTDTVFLRVLQNGKNVTLFAYQDQVKKRFYILEKGNSVPIELKRNIYYRTDGGQTAVTENKYAGQLLYISTRLNPDVHVDEWKWKQIRYQESDLVKVVSALNHQEVKKSKAATTRFFAGTGLNISKASYSGNNNLSGDDAITKNSYLPYLNVGVELFANPAIKKLIYRAELSLSGSKYNITKVSNIASNINTGSSTIEHVFNQYTVQLAPQVIYNLYNTNKLKFFVSAGAGLNFSTYDKNVSTTTHPESYYGERVVVEENPVDFQKFYFSPRLNTGIVLHNRLELTAGYSPRAVITRYISYSVGVQSIRIGVNLLINKD